MPMQMRLPRPRHGDSFETTAQLRELAAAVLTEDVHALARTTAYLRRSYRVVFIGYIAMLVFGIAAVIAAFVKGMTAASVGQAVAAIGLAGLTVGVFTAFGVQTKYRQLLPGRSVARNRGPC